MHNQVSDPFKKFSQANWYLKPFGTVGRERISVFIIFIFLFGFFALLSSRALFSAFFPDDAGYYLKTAWNFEKGLGSTFDGINITNGYHPLWFMCLVLLAKIAFWLNWTEQGFLFLATITNVVLMSLALVFLYEIIKPLGASIALGSVLIVGAVSELVGGINLLETSLQLLCMLVLFNYLFRVCQKKINFSQLLLIVMLLYLAFLARLDGIFLFAGVGLWLLIRRLYKEFIHYIIIATLVLLIHFCVYYYLYNSFMPVSGYIKSNDWVSVAEWLDRLFMPSLSISFFLPYFYPQAVYSIMRVSYPLVLLISLLGICLFLAKRRAIASVSILDSYLAILLVFTCYLLAKLMYYMLTNSNQNLLASNWYWAADGLLVNVVMACMFLYFLRVLAYRVAGQWGSRLWYSCLDHLVFLLPFLLVLGVLSYRLSQLSSIPALIDQTHILVLSFSQYHLLVALLACLGCMLVYYLATGIARYGMDHGKSHERFKRLRILLLSMPIVYFYALHASQVSPAFARMVYTNFTATHFDMAELLQGKSDFSNYRIGCHDAGILGFFSDRQIVNLDGLINSIDYALNVIRNDNPNAALVDYIKNNLDIVLAFYEDKANVIRETGFVEIDVSPYIDNPYKKDHSFALRAGYYFFVRPAYKQKVMNILSTQ